MIKDWKVWKAKTISKIVMLYVRRHHFKEKFKLDREYKHLFWLHCWYKNIYFRFHLKTLKLKWQKQQQRKDFQIQTRRRYWTEGVENRGKGKERESNFFHSILDLVMKVAKVNGDNVLSILITMKYSGQLTFHQRLLESFKLLQ